MNFLKPWIQNLSSFKWNEHLNWFATASLIAAFACLLALIYAGLARLLAPKSKKTEEDLIAMLLAREKKVQTNSLRLLNPTLASNLDLKTDVVID
ncbi:MAG: hypothetical protein WCI18_06360 [Pseudomonadota bacterium]